ncbi:MAG: hypothetical protein IPG04_04185 [Polyangiaceae bacterium]|jgi:hypothetical protein|nr:hypothetical protein [Polyangiaceae bacterium]
MAGTSADDAAPNDTTIDEPRDTVLEEPDDTVLDEPGASGASASAAGGEHRLAATLPPPTDDGRSTLTEPIAAGDRSTHPDLEPEARSTAPDEGEGEAPPEAEAAKPKRRALLYWVIGAIFALSVTGPLVFYFFVWRYRPTAPHHIPAGTSLAVRFDGRELYTYKPFRQHVLGALDGSSAANSRLDRLKKHTGIDLKNDVREIIYATKTADSWVVLIGGNFDLGRGKKKFVSGLKAFLDEEGVEGFTLDGDTLKGPSLFIAQAEDTTLLIANNDEILRAATEPSDAYKDLALASSGAVSFVIDRAVFEAFSKDPVGRAPPLAGVSEDKLEHLKAACKVTQKMTGHLRFKRSGVITIEVLPTAGAREATLTEAWEQVRVDAKDVPALTSFDSAGLVDAFLDAKLKNRAETTMVTVDWDKKRLDAGLEQLGAKIRELLGS